MKKIIFIIILILSSAMVFAIPAGTINTVEYFNKCDSLRVNVSGNLEIIKGEYNLINCNETESNSWYCDCEDDYDLLLNTTIYTINNYHFNIRHNFTDVLTEIKSSGGGSSYYGDITPTNTEVKEYVYVYPGQLTNFKISSGTHSIKLLSHINGVYRFEVRSTPQIVELRKNESKIITLDNVMVKLSLVKDTDAYYKLKIEEISEVISPAATTTTTTITTTTINKEIIERTNKSIEQRKENQTQDIVINKNKEKNNFTLIYIIAMIIIIVVVILVGKYNEKNN